MGCLVFLEIMESNKVYVSALKFGNWFEGVPTCQRRGTLSMKMNCNCIELNHVNYVRGLFWMHNDTKQQQLWQL